MAGLVPYVEGWVRHRRVHSRRGLSANSEIAYRQDLAALARRIADFRSYPEAKPVGPGPRVPNAVTNGQLARVQPDDLTAESVAEVASQLVRENKSAATRARMLAAWRGFCRWMVLEGDLAMDPTLAFETPLPDGRLPVAFSEEELAAVLDAAGTEVESDAELQGSQRRARWSRRDVAIVGVLAGAGLRAAELLGLRMGGIERKADDKGNRSYVLRVMGKGSKERVVPVAAEVVVAIDIYLDERRSSGLGGSNPDDIVFVRTNGRPLNTQALDYLVDNWMGAAGVTLRAGEKAHAFRHTYALGQVENGTSVAELMQLLGHADLSTTGVYLRMAAADLQHAARAAPVAHMLRQHLASPAVRLGDEEAEPSPPPPVGLA